MASNVVVLGGAGVMFNYNLGSELIFWLCQQMKVNVIVLEAKKEITFEEELSSDVIELMTVFCAKLYGKRSHKNKLQNNKNMCYNPSIT